MDMKLLEGMINRYFLKKSHKEYDDVYHDDHVRKMNALQDIKARHQQEIEESKEKVKKLREKIDKYNNTKKPSLLKTVGHMNRMEVHNRLIDKINKHKEVLNNLDKNEKLHQKEIDKMYNKIEYK